LKDKENFCYSIFCVANLGDGGFSIPDNLGNCLFDPKNLAKGGR